MPNYQNGKIYKIVSFQTDKVYVGSTTQSLSKRMVDHKSMCKTRPDKGTTSKQILAYDDATIVLIENYGCDDKAELHARERHWIETLDCVNKCIPGRTMKEWTDDNREILSEKKKVYYIANKDKIIKYHEQYNELNKDILIVKRKHRYNNNKEIILERNRVYYNANKDKVTDKIKQWRIKNKDKIRSSTTCVCGGSWSYGKQKRHLNTKKHKDYVQ